MFSFPRLREPPVRVFLISHPSGRRAMPTLAEISPGQSATIVNILGEDAVSMRLMEMGVMDGETVEVIGRAPMGDPIEISVRGYRLSLRNSEAQRIEVEYRYE